MMNRNLTRNGIEPLSRASVKTELRRLLKGRRVTPSRGIFERSERIGVVAGMLAGEGRDVVNITVLVYGRERQPAEVEGIPVTLTGQTPQGTLILWVGKTNHRGDVGFLNLEAGDYAVRIPDSCGRSSKLEAWATAASNALAAQGTERIEERQEPEPRVYESSDGTVRATALQRWTGELEVAFETEASELAYATVVFSFVSENRKVEKSGRAQLYPVSTEPGLWEGDWAGTVDVSEPCELIFEVLHSDYET